MYSFYHTIGLWDFKGVPWISNKTNKKKISTQMWQTKCKIVACILYFLIILPIYFIVLLFSWTSTVMYHVCRSSTFIACIFFGSSLYLWYGCKHKKDLARLSTFFSRPHNFLVLVSHFYFFAHWYLMPLFLFFQAPWFF